MLNFSYREENRVEKLTSREIEILKLVVKGYSNEEIAKELFISKHTVKMHISIMIQKLGLKNRCEIAYMAGKKNIV